MVMMTMSRNGDGSDGGYPHEVEEWLGLKRFLKSVFIAAAVESKMSNRPITRTAICLFWSGVWSSSRPPNADPEMRRVAEIMSHSFCVVCSYGMRLSMCICAFDSMYACVCV